MMTPNEKAAWWRLQFWPVFRRQFLIYGFFVTLMAFTRMLLGQVHADFMGFLSWEAVYLPLVAVLAAVLAYREAGSSPPPEPDRQ